MNRSRAVLVLSVVLVVAAGLAVTSFLTHGAGEGGDAAVLRGSGAGSAEAPALTGLSTEAPRTPAELAAGKVAPAPGESGPAADEAAVPTRELHGRVTMADGSKLPLGLTVLAQKRRPAPQIGTLRDTVGGPGRDDADDEHRHSEPGGPGVGSLEADALAAATTKPAAGAVKSARAAVAEDGSFQLAGVPMSAVWLTVDDEMLYPDPAVHVEADEGTADLLLVRGASLSGRITDASGAGVSKAALGLGTKFDPFMVFDQGARMLRMEVDVDGDGHYLARQVPTGLRLIVAASAKAGNLQPAQTEIAALHTGEQRVLDLTLPAGHVVAGRVEHADKTPLPGATVHLRRLDLGMMDMAATAMVTGDDRDELPTDSDGRFRFEAVADGEWEVLLGTKGWRQAHSGKLVLRGGTDVTDLVLLAEEGLAVTGRVVDEAGQPLEGASVEGFRPPSFTSMRVNLDRQYRDPSKTGEDGRFRLDGLEAGKVRLAVRANGFSPGKLDVQAGDEEVLVTLAALTAVSGIVVSLDDGEPVPDFKVTLLPEGGLIDLANMDKMEERMSSLRGARSFHAREDGTFTLTDVQPGTYDLTVASPGFGSTLVGALEVEPEGVKGLVVMLPPESLLTGTVVSARDGRPVADATVSTGKRGMLSAMTDSLVGTGPEATTGPDGRFELKGIAGNTAVNLTVKHPTFRELAVAEQVLAPGESRDLGRLLLSVGSAVHGHVLDTNGRPVPDTVVMASNANATSIKRATADETGAYRIEGLSPGSYNVMRMDFAMNVGDDNPGNMMKDMVFRAVTLAENEDKLVDLSAKATGGTRLSGRVTASDGPVPSAMLVLLPENGGMTGMQFSSTDKEGHYAIEGVPTGKYVLQVTVLDGNNAATAGQATSPVAEQIAIAGQPEQSHDVVLPGGEIHGSVENAVDGAYLPGVRVVLERVDAGRPDFGFTAATNGRVGESYTRDGGGFGFRYLPAGTYELVAGGQNLIGMGAKGWSQTRVKGLTVNSSGAGFGVRVKVKPAGGVEGFVRSTSGVPLPGVGVWVADANGSWQSTLSEISTDSAGAYSVGSLQEGSWTLAFRDGTHALKLLAGVLVKEGQTTKQDVALQPGIALQLLTAGHTPGSLQTTLVGPDGALPTGLVSMSELMTMTDLGSALNLGTFAPGAYHLTVMSGGETLLSTTVTLSGSGAQTVSLEP